MLSHKLSASLEDQLVFYGQFHLHRINIFIHYIFVPLLLWCFFAVLAHIPTIVVLDSLYVNAAFFASFLCIFYYTMMEVIAGLLISPLIILMSFIANIFVLHYQDALQVIIILASLGLFFQVLGHFLFEERRRPAFMGNGLEAFFTSLLVAPFFIFLELLFTFGYRPTLHRRIKEKIATGGSTLRRRSAFVVK